MLSTHTSETNELGRELVDVCVKFHLAREGARLAISHEIAGSHHSVSKAGSGLYAGSQSGRGHLVTCSKRSMANFAAAD
jgi:hypothetical protein